MSTSSSAHTPKSSPDARSAGTVAVESPPTAAVWVECPSPGHDERDQQTNLRWMSITKVALNQEQRSLSRAQEQLTNALESPELSARLQGVRELWESKMKNAMKWGSTVASGPRIGHNGAENAAHEPRLILSHRPSPPASPLDRPQPPTLSPDSSLLNIPPTFACIPAVVLICYRPGC